MTNGTKCHWGKARYKQGFKGVKVFDSRSTTGITKFQIFKDTNNLKDFHISRAHRGKGSKTKTSSSSQQTSWLNLDLLFYFTILYENLVFINDFSLMKHPHLSS